MQTLSIASILFASCALGVFCLTPLANAQAPRTDALQSAPNYILGPLDSVFVTVLRHPEFSGEFTIPPNGTVDLPGAGPVKLSGLDLDAASGVIREHLLRRLKKPDVSVALRTTRPVEVSVVGDVRSPGIHTYRPGWRISDALAAGGGLTEGLRIADAKAVVLRAATNNRDTVAVKDVLSGDGSGNLTLAPGDIVTISGPESWPIYVVGEVKSPGLYHLRADNAGVPQALIAAGGANEDAAYDKIHVIHLNGDQEDVNVAPTMIKGEATKTPPLQAGDLVIVSESRQKIGVFGFVTSPGVFTLQPGKPLTLAEAIGLAKGPAANARLVKVGVAQTTPTGLAKARIYDLSRYFKTGDASQNPYLIAGEVVYVPRAPDHFDWLQGLGVVLQGAALYNILR
jgi:protein involved in polysaccharide export with SLBB domain